jgi:ABC-2 type transport system permease protein
MAVYKRGYQRYDGPRIASRRRRLLVLPRYAWKRLFEQRLMVAALIIAMFWPLLCSGFIYLANHAEMWPGLGSNFVEALKIDGRFFLVFANTQAAFAVILAAIAGPGLVAPDLANNALPLYFSRPLTRAGYAAARLLTIFGMLSLVTVIPGLLLFLMQAGMAGWGWAAQNWRYGVALIAGFLLWNGLVSLVALASSAWVRWRVIAGGLVLGFFFVTAGASEMINAVFRDTWGSWMNPTQQMYGLWSAMLGTDPPRDFETATAVVSLGILIAALVFILERKLRPVEVIA